MASQCAAKRCLPSSTEVTWRSMPAAAASTSASSSVVCARTQNQIIPCNVHLGAEHCMRRREPADIDAARLLPVRGAANIFKAKGRWQDCPAWLARGMGQRKQSRAAAPAHS